MPTVVNYGPKSGRAGLPLNIIGKDFSSMARPRVKFGQLEVDAEVKNDQHVRTEIPVGIANGPVAVSVVSDNGPDLFVGAVVVGTVPDGTAMTDVYPNEIPMGGNVTVALFGFGFPDVGIEAGATAVFGSSSRPVSGTVVESTMISVLAPAWARGDSLSFNVSVRFASRPDEVFTAAEQTRYV